MLTLSETAQALVVLDRELTQLESDLQEVRRQKDFLNLRENEIKSRSETLKMISKEILTHKYIL